MDSPSPLWMLPSPLPGKHGGPLYFSVLNFYEGLFGYLRFLKGNIYSFYVTIFLCSELYKTQCVLGRSQQNSEGGPQFQVLWLSETSFKCITNPAPSCLLFILLKPPLCPIDVA